MSTALPSMLYSVWTLNVVVFGENSSGTPRGRAAYGPWPFLLSTQLGRKFHSIYPFTALSPFAHSCQFCPLSSSRKYKCWASNTFTRDAAPMSQPLRLCFPSTASTRRQSRPVGLEAKGAEISSSRAPPSPYRKATIEGREGKTWKIERLEMKPALCADSVGDCPACMQLEVARSPVSILRNHCVHVVALLREGCQTSHLRMLPGALCIAAHLCLAGTSSQINSVP